MRQAEKEDDWLRAKTALNEIGMEVENQKISYFRDQLDQPKEPYKILEKCVFSPAQ